jgi:hypothetical protein
MKLSEQQARVLERLVEAMETDIALPVRVGPRKFGSSMPEYYMTAKDIRDVETWCVNQRQDYQNRARWEGRNRAVHQRTICSPRRISRMEQALDWVISWVWDAEVRECLLAYVTVKARSGDWGRYVTARNRRNPRKKAWLRQNSYRWISKSLQIIEQQLAKSELFLNNEGDLQMRQIEPELACKSTTSVLHVQTPPEEIPA